jgi:hypothetical protein
VAQGFLTKRNVARGLEDRGSNSEKTLLLQALSDLSAKKSPKGVKRFSRQSRAASPPSSSRQLKAGFGAGRGGSPLFLYCRLQPGDAVETVTNVTCDQPHDRL